MPTLEFFSALMNYAPKQNVVNILRELISHDVDVQTGQLPPERELSQRLGQSRRAVRNGLAILAEEGIIRRKQGQGTFIIGRGSSPVGDLSKLMEQISPMEIIEVRLALEPRHARLAALRASRCDISRLQHLIDAAEKSEDLTTYRRFDAAFHRKIAESARNQLFLLIYDLVTVHNGDPATLRLGELGRCNKRKAIYADHHRMIVQAIIERDADSAESAMRNHIADVQRQIIETITS